MQDGQGKWRAGDWGGDIYDESTKGLMIMSNALDPVAQLARALDQAGAIISRIKPEQSTLPTPCRSWDVRSLVTHLLDAVQQFSVIATGGQWNAHANVEIGEDWSAAYLAAADTLLATWRRPGALDGTIQLPFGEFPVTWRLELQIAELAIHGWDIAKATGQSSELDPEVGQAALDWAKQNVLPQYRSADEGGGQSFGLEVPVQADAPLYDRLAGFVGRNPH
ncbi:MAG: uncharacterized protein JWO59_339 [Chloroflexi bacterium]|nr:uncharacterized protein [Chloroflexota bacterium]